jgi:hypothetical protein
VPIGEQIGEQVGEQVGEQIGVPCGSARSRDLKTYGSWDQREVALRSC